MNSKALIWIGMSVGTFFGGLVPLLWGGSTFSFSSVLLGGVGGIAGIWLGFKIGRE